MDNKNNRNRAAGVAGLIAIAAVVGAVVGTSSVASAATTTPTPLMQTQGQPPVDLFSNTPVRSDEKALGATEAAKVTAAQAAVEGASVFRVETDADGDAYEAHMKKADGTIVTVKLDANFTVTSTEEGFGAGGPHGGQHHDPTGITPPTTGNAG